jgi:hypothetical protein
MAKQGPSSTFQQLEVPSTSVGSDTSMRPPLGMENQLTSPKTIEDLVKKSVQFGYGRTGFQYDISTTGGANY